MIPGYEGSGSLGQIIIGTLHGMVDGFIGGLIVGWAYNVFARVPASVSTS